MGAKRYLAIGLGAFGAIAALTFLLLFKPFASPAVAQGPGHSGATYVGVATCGGTTCHGRSQSDGPVVRQDELMLWQDPATAAGAHSRAWSVLREPRAQAIANRLGIGEATGAPMCLGCHATPAGPRGLRFQTSDGVGCESCHGPASGWLSSHYVVGGTHAANVSRGLVPLDNPRARAAQSLARGRREARPRRGCARRRRWPGPATGAAHPGGRSLRPPRCGRGRWCRRSWRLRDRCRW